MIQKKEEDEQKSHLEKGLRPSGNREVSEDQGREQGGKQHKTRQNRGEASNHTANRWAFGDFILRAKGSCSIILNESQHLFFIFNLK